MRFKNWLVVFAFVPFVLFAQPSSLSSFSDCVLWLRSDSLVTLDGSSKVMQWGDLSNNGIVLSQTSSSSRPGIMDSSALCGYPSLTFNGGTTILNFDSVLSLSSITAFFVLNPYSRSFNGFFGGPANPHHFSMSEFNTAFRLNGDVPAIYLPVGPNFITTNGYQVIDLRTKGSSYMVAVNNILFPDSADYVSAPTLINKIGRRAVNGPYLGEHIEMIFYDRELTNSEIDDVYDYLNARYSREIDIGNDISVSSFCIDTTFIADSLNFTEVIWNGTDTGFTYNTVTFGQVTVSAKDKLNRISYDTVDVGTNLQLFSKLDTFLCVNNTFSVSTFLPNANYMFQWQDSSTDSFFLISQPGQYYCTISDMFGCSITTDTITVFVDSFSVNNSLGPDTSFCAGSIIEFNTMDSVVSYNWSTSDTTQSIVVNSSGNYALNAVNFRGCIFQDNINVAVLGVAPTVDFFVDTTCFGDSTDFLDLTTVPPPDGIATWQWIIDSDTLGVQNPIYYFDTTGTFNVMLTAISDSGCFSFTQKSAEVIPPPASNFVIPVVCEGDSISLSSSSVGGGTNDPITNFNWFVNGTFFNNGNSISLNTLSEGAYSIKHIVQTQKGCVDSIERVLDVFPKVSPNFSFENTCLGDAVSFTDISQSFSIISWNWDFGTGNDFSGTQNPIFIYSQVDTFPVTLTIQNAIGCVNDTTIEVEIIAPPQLDIIPDTFCIGQPVTISLQESLLDPTVQWDWEIDGQMFDIQSPEVIFSDVDDYLIKVTSLTNAGCEIMVTDEIEIIAGPTANFEYNPRYGVAPLDVQFGNLSLNANFYQWDFGDGSPADFSASPSHQYGQNGIYNITLIAEDAYGCVNQFSDEININPTTLDIELNGINTDQSTNLLGREELKLEVLFSNVGSREIENVKFVAQVNNETKVLELWQGTLVPLQNGIYQFTTSYLLPENDQAKYICVEAVEVNDNTEVNLSNNKYCKVLEGLFEASIAYPNPSKDQVFLDLISKNNGIASIEIVNIYGEVVESNKALAIVEGHNKIAINTQPLSAGKYVIGINFLNQSLTREIIVSNE